ncbi:hypothetical protein F5X68DRAFT_258547 [Plectosphaerella plurivora]|uniref:Uncharacterized protein n=1 Tax=Plectosphaerella plurivora TaxID=936078 RepID=A0A9P9AGH4_9PEZI|nr:hypothetical protein F5X68DRAFT_258547 [Plectosphaerella plurivora]
MMAVEPDATHQSYSTEESILSQALMPRSRMVAEDTFTARMLINKITEYPCMMATGKILPPFIHPPCASHKQPCPEGKPHTCLPDALAVCASNLGAVYSSTNGGDGSAWSQIYGHVSRLSAVFATLDISRQLQALQVVVLYVLLQSQDENERATKDAAGMVSTAEAFSRQIYGRTDLHKDVEPDRVERDDWIFLETLKRVGCLLYMIDLLLNIEGRTPSRGQCPEAICVTLPCNSVLWGTVADDEWRWRHQELTMANRKRGGRMLTLGDLLLLKSPLLPGETDEAFGRGVEDQLSEWSENADDFGMLLWMAMMLERDGQTFIINMACPPALVAA